VVGHNKPPDCPQSSIPDRRPQISAMIYLNTDVSSPSLLKVKLRYVTNTIKMVLSIFIMKDVNENSTQIMM
jgi:hypothetical protein